MTNALGDAKEILERILNSYGVRSRPELAELLQIPLPTINNWVARSSLPGDYIIQCAIDTGADLKWLISGELENVRLKAAPHDFPKGKELHEQLLANGGKQVVQRILHAYGFTMQKELGDLLGIPSGTMSAWVRRDYFPGDVVITCALDTGVSLRWLATGIGEMSARNNCEQISSNGIVTIEKYSLFNGELNKTGLWVCDPSLIAETVNNPALVEKGSNKWIVDLNVKAIGNGLWLINIDGVNDVYTVSRIPGNKINVKNLSSNFDCKIEDVECVGMVYLTLMENN